MPIPFWKPGGGEMTGGDTGLETGAGTGDWVAGLCVFKAVRRASWSNTSDSVVCARFFVGEVIAAGGVGAGGAGGGAGGDCAVVGGAEGALAVVAGGVAAGG